MYEHDADVEFDEDMCSVAFPAVLTNGPQWTHFSDE